MTVTELTLHILSLHGRRIHRHPGAFRSHQAFSRRTRLCQATRRQTTHRRFTRARLFILPKSLQLNALLQAYDGHMNLILSDVEETIMIVDLDGTTGPQGTVNVCDLSQFQVYKVQQYT